MLEHHIYSPYVTFDLARIFACCNILRIVGGRSTGTAPRTHGRPTPAARTDARSRRSSDFGRHTRVTRSLEEYTFTALVPRGHLHPADPPLSLRRPGYDESRRSSPSWCRSGSSAALSTPSASRTLSLDTCGHQLTDVAASTLAGVHRKRAAHLENPADADPVSAAF